MSTSQSFLSGLRRRSFSLLTLGSFLGTHCLFPMAAAYAQAAGGGGAQGGSAPPWVLRVPPSAPLLFKGRTSLRLLDLSRVPTEAQLRALGGRRGPLSPTGPADAEPIAVAPALQQLILDGTLVKGLTPAQHINISFGHAAQAWANGQFVVAAGLFRRHLQLFPQSPWAGEARLRLAEILAGRDRGDEAQGQYQVLLAGTSEDADDPSYEVHQKAKVGWSALEMGQGNWAEAALDLGNILDTDNDWKRLTWARHWLGYMALYQDTEGTGQQAAAPRALGALLVSLGRKNAGAQVARLRPPTGVGRSGRVSRTAFGLDDLRRIAARHQVALRSVRGASVPLASLPTPFLAQMRTPGAPSWGHTSAPSPASTRTNVGSPSVGAGRFVVVERIEARGAGRDAATVYDVETGRESSLLLSQVQRQWSGHALALTPTAVRTATRAVGLQGRPQSLVGLCPFGGGGGVGIIDATAQEEQLGTPEAGAGVNMVNTNVFLQDAPIGYKTEVGPSVGISLSYNTQDALSSHSVFGNKRMWSYGSYIQENSSGSVILFRPDGGQDLYKPKTGGGFTGEVGIFDTLTQTGTHQFVIESPGGAKNFYAVPAGTGVTQPLLVESRDPWGYSLLFGYNAGAQLTSITDAQSRVTSFTYNTAGYVSQVTDPFGRTASFTYDSSGNLTLIADLGGVQTGYVYDSSARVTQRILPSGTTYYTHEGPDSGTASGYPAPGGTMGANRRLTITDALGQKEEYFFAAAQHQTWHVSKKQYVAYTSTFNNSSTSVAKSYFTAGVVIDGKGKISGSQAPTGGGSSPTGSTSTGYDTVTGQPNQVTDERGKITSGTYNGWGLPTSVTKPNNGTSSITYAANGRDVIGVTNALNLVQLAGATYNAQHQPLSVTDGLNHTTSTTYTAWGVPLTVTDAANKVTSYDYDSTTKRLTQIRRGSIVLASFSYDTIGRVIGQVDAAGTATGTTYNTRDQVTQVTYADGSTSANSYGAAHPDQVLASYDRAGRSVNNSYDALGRLTGTQEKSATGTTLRSTALEYDADNNRTGLRDASNTLTSWSYDNQGRMTGKQYANSTGYSLGYDAAGNLTSRTDAQSRTTQYTYDDNSNLTIVDYPIGALAPDVSLSYDLADRATGTTDGLGTTSYSYDILGRALSVDGPFANDTVSYSYDVLGRRSGLGVAGQATTVGYGFDTLDRLSQITSGVGTFGYSYVGNSGMLSQLSMPNGTTSSYTYDTLERNTGIGNRRSNTSLISGYAFGYDNTNKRDLKLWVDEQVGTAAVQRVNFSYDGLDQLTGEVASPTAPTRDRSYSYDARGNRLSSGTASGASTYSGNSLNQLQSTTFTPAGANPSPSTYLLGYDLSGNTTSMSLQGGSTQGGTRYVYDEENRLTRLTQADPATGTPQRKSEFLYDGQNRKVVSREYLWNAGTSTWSQTDEVRRVYDGMNVVQERDATNTVTANYTRSGNISGLLSRTTAAGTFFYHYDGRGNVVQMSDAAQGVAAEYTYDAYGNTLTATGAQAQSNPYRYSTKEFQSASGLYDYGYRFYSPGLGRWINRDPIEEEDGVHLYAMVGNNPANLNDPLGLRQRTIQDMMTDPNMGYDPYYHPGSFPPGSGGVNPPLPNPGNPTNWYWNQPKDTTPPPGPHKGFFDDVLKARPDLAKIPPGAWAPGSPNGNPWGQPGGMWPRPVFGSSRQATIGEGQPGGMWPARPGEATSPGLGRPMVQIPAMGVRDPTGSFHVDTPPPMMGGGAGTGRPWEPTPY